MSLPLQNKKVMIRKSKRDFQDIITNLSKYQEPAIQSIEGNTVPPPKEETQMPKDRVTLQTEKLLMALPKEREEEVYRNG